MRIDEFEDTDLLGDDLADLPGGEVGHQLGDQAAVPLGLELTMLHRLLNCGDHGLISAVLRSLPTVNTDYFSNGKVIYEAKRSLSPSVQEINQKLV